MRRFAPSTLTAMLMLLCLGLATATETKITVRVLSHGAKFLGTSMGGGRVTITDVETGELLAQGVLAGSTGNTEQIMVADDKRHWDPVGDEGSGQFTATLDLQRPRLVEVEVFGPLAQRQAAMTASARQWIVPGKDVTGGDGFLLTLRGFAVDVLAPPSHVRLGQAPQTVTIRANVTMMCGCPLTPDGLWDTRGFEIRAIVRHNGKKVGETPLTYAGQASQFEGSWKAAEPGVYEILVYAYDPANGNTGLDATTFILK